MTQVTQDSDIKVASKQKNVQRQALQIASPLLSLRLFAMGIVGQGGHCVLATNARERRKVDWSFAERRFGFAYVDIKVPKELWKKKYPCCFTTNPFHVVPCHCPSKDSLTWSRCKPMHDQRKLVYTLLVFNPVVQMTMLNDYAAEMFYNWSSRGSWTKS